MRWTLKPKADKDQVRNLAASLNVSPLIAELLVQRNIASFEEARTFFRPSLEDLHDPMEMCDMELAVGRIRSAIERGENILVYGDYDVDGTTAVALVYAYLSGVYPNIATYIPDRYSEGYGVSIEGIDYAADNDVKLIIALDCGVKAVAQVAYAKERGIDFIVCDHHRPGDNLPDAVAVLDPKREDCNYPFKELSGCGIGYKLIQALSGESGDAESLLPYLDLVATSIAADIVPIVGENRILAYYGLQQINTAPRPGIRALMELNTKKTFTITDVVFGIAPRINAAGRIKHGQHAVNLLVEEDPEKALAMAREIETLNATRKGLDQQITEEALAQIEELGEQEAYTTVVYNPEWHKGVIGIVASRLIETFYRPTLVFTSSGDKLAASARSVKGFDIYRALEACEPWLEQFGGHKYAAGLTLRESQFEDFKKQFEKVVSETINPELLVPEILVDSPIQASSINPKLIRILKQFAPFGPGNSNPVFMAEHLRDAGYARQVGEKRQHLKLAVRRDGATPLDGIGFNLGPKFDEIKGGLPFSAVFALEENEWNGATRPQLKIKDIRQD